MSKFAILVALLAIGGTAGAADAGLSYLSPQATAALKPPTGASIPERPLAHPITTIVQLNRRGEDVFRVKGAPVYLAVGALALVSDHQMLRWFRAPGVGESPSGFSRTFSSLAEPKVIVPAILGLQVFGSKHERETVKLLVASGLNATLWTQSMKFVTGKERPDGTGKSPTYHGPSNFSNDSFPSGHTSLATSCAVILGHQYPKSKMLWYGLALAVGVARIERGAHYPSDVYWGAGVGYYAAWQTLRNQDAILTWRF